MVCVRLTLSGPCSFIISMFVFNLGVYLGYSVVVCVLFRLYSAYIRAIQGSCLWIGKKKKGKEKAMRVDVDDQNAVRISVTMTRMFYDAMLLLFLSLYAVSCANGVNTRDNDHTNILISKLEKAISDVGFDVTGREGADDAGLDVITRKAGADDVAYGVMRRKRADDGVVSALQRTVEQQAATIQQLQSRLHGG